MAPNIGKNSMAHDEREYVKARHGWSITNLTGFRRTASQIEKNEPAFYNPKEFRRANKFAREKSTLPNLEFKGTNKEWKIIFSLIWIALVLFTAWTIYRN